MHGIEIGPLQLCIQPAGLFAKIIGDGADSLLQRAEQFERQLGLHLIIHQLLAMQVVPAALYSAQWAFQWRRCLAAETGEGPLIELSAIHAARAFEQVVRFVHQHADTPVVVERQAVEQGADVEIVVVVADHGVRPARQLLAEVIGANLMGEGDLAQGRLIEHALLQCRCSGCRQTIIEAFRQRAGFTVAGLVRVLAGLVTRDQFEHTQFTRAVAL